MNWYTTKLKMRFGDADYDVISYVDDSFKVILEYKTRIPLEPRLTGINLKRLHEL